MPELILSALALAIAGLVLWSPYLLLAGVTIAVVAALANTLDCEPDPDEDAR